LAQLEGLAGRQPVLMVWEDVHWSDPTSRELLDLTVNRVPALPILLIVTYRPEFTAPWVGRSHVTLLSLNRLPPRQRAEMIAHMTGGKALPKEIADQIIDRTDGVPLFIEELTKTVVESGVLTDLGDHFTVAGPVPPLAIPTSLNASLLARLDRLAPAREVAQIGAALGRQFSHELISAVAPMPEQQVDDALSQLVSAELIFRRGTPPDAEYTFKHALVQDAAYSTLLRSRRRQLHGRIAATLEESFGEIVTTQPGLLAQHCAQAGLAEKAVNYWLKAGRQAIARCAMIEAVAQLRKGLDIVASAPEGPARREGELDLQIALGNALIAAKGFAAPEADEAFARARQLCDQLNRPPQLGVLRGQWSFRLSRGELDQAEHHADETRHLAQARNDVMWKCFGFTMSGATCLFLGKFIDARAYLENALSFWDSTFRASTAAAIDPYVAALMYLSRTLLCLGYIDQARFRRDEGSAEARQLSPSNVAFALSLSWNVNLGIESARTILRSADEMLAISSELGFPMWSGTANMMRGWCLGTLGQAAEGIPLLLQGIADLRATGSNLGFPSGLTRLAEVYGMAAQPEEGLNRLAKAAELVETTQERWAEAEMHRLRGTLLLSKHEQAAAENSYLQALAVARRQSAKFWELRAALDLTRLWRDQGKRDEARNLLAPVYGWFTEGFDTLDLKEAKRLLDELAA
jgi:predicted ATPase